MVGLYGKVLNEIRAGNPPGHCNVSLELVAVSGEVGSHVMAVLFQSSKWLRTPTEWVLSIVVPILKGKCSVMNGSCYTVMKLPKHGMKVVERVLE